MVDDRVIAWCGALHPELQRALDHEVYLAELELSSLGPHSPPVSYEPLSRYPAVSRDLSFVAPRDLAWDHVSQALRAVEAPAPCRIEPVDRYEGPPLGGDEVSLSVRFTLEPRERTLTDGETEAYRTKLIECLERELRVRIRG
jgi:phenylalanyl-tRNA synthetase beta chain